MSQWNVLQRYLDIISIQNIQIITPPIFSVLIGGEQNGMELKLITIDAQKIYNK